MDDLLYDNTKYSVFRQKTYGDIQINIDPMKWIKISVKGTVH